VKRSLEEHVRMEADVLAHVEEEMRHTRDEGLKLLLRHIAEDEKKHHKILEEIVKNLYKITWQSDMPVSLIVGYLNRVKLLPLTKAILLWGS
jgi:rubrerythrin